MEVPRACEESRPKGTRASPRRAAEGELSARIRRDQLTSMMSGGRRSFSISLFRLQSHQRCLQEHEGQAHASSKPWIASLIPSAPDANIPAGSVLDPEMLLSSDTLSDSSLSDKWISTRPCLWMSLHLPQQSKYPRHPTDRQDLVFDDLSSFARAIVHCDGLGQKSSRSVGMMAYLLPLLVYLA